MSPQTWEFVGLGYSLPLRSEAPWDSCTISPANSLGQAGFYALDRGLLGAELSPPTQIRGSLGLRLRLPSDSGLPGVGAGSRPQSELPGTGAASWPPSGWGKGLWDPQPLLRREGGGAPLRPCPLRDKPEVSGDQDTPSWVQGAAQGVVTGGYLGRPCAGTARKPAARRPALGAGHGVDPGLPFRLGL